MLVDHCLRSGYYETALKLAKDSQIEVGLKQSRVVYLKKKLKLLMIEKHVYVCHLELCIYIHVHVATH